MQQGKLYRLQSPEDGESARVQYISEDGSQSVVFAYLHSQHYGMQEPRTQLQGLDPKASYRVAPLDAAKYRGDEIVSGEVLMSEGMEIRLAGDYDSTALVEVLLAETRTLELRGLFCGKLVAVLVGRRALMLESLVLAGMQVKTRRAGIGKAVVAF